jgi:RNA polymerase sigma factor (sigma-70 family)
MGPGVGDEAQLVQDFGGFYRAHLDVVLAYCMVRVRNPEVAADLAAEIFAAALIARLRYRADRGTPTQWLFGIAANKIADAGRRGRVERHAQARLGMAEIQWSEDDLERVAALAGEPEVSGMLARLPRDQREAVYARVVEEHSYEQIAIAHGVGEATARKRVSRGLTTLRALVSKEKHNG